MIRRSWPLNRSRAAPLTAPGTFIINSSLTRLFWGPGLFLAESGAGTGFFIQRDPGSLPKIPQTIVCFTFNSGVRGLIPEWYKRLTTAPGMPGADQAEAGRREALLAPGCLMRTRSAARAVPTPRPRPAPVRRAAGPPMRPVRLKKTSGWRAFCRVGGYARATVDFSRKHARKMRVGRGFNSGPYLSSYLNAWRCQTRWLLCGSVALGDFQCLGAPIPSPVGA